MEQIYMLLREQVSPDLTKTIAKGLKSDEDSIGNAISSIIAGFLVLTRMNGNTMQISNIFEEAGSLDIQSRLDAVCTKPLTPEMLSVGDNFLQHVLGDSATDFTVWIALQTNLSKVTINALIAILAPIYVSFIGDKIITNRWSLHKVFGMISNQTDLYKNFNSKSIM